MTEQETTDTTLVLDDEARRCLGEVYRLLLSLAEEDEANPIETEANLQEGE